MTLAHRLLLYVETGRLHMGIPADGAASRFGETAPFFKDKAAGEAAAGSFQEFFPLAPHRAFYVGQVVDSLLFRDADTLGYIAQGCLPGPEEVDDLLPYRPVIVGRRHVPSPLLYSSTRVEPSSPCTSKYLLSG